MSDFHHTPVDLDGQARAEVRFGRALMTRALTSAARAGASPERHAWLSLARARAVLTSQVIHRARGESRGSQPPTRRVPGSAV